jgi:hypothetical protein
MPALSARPPVPTRPRRRLALHWGYRRRTRGPGNTATRGGCRTIAGNAHAYILGPFALAIPSPLSGWVARASFKTPELSWGRQSPQLTPTPSSSPSPKISHRKLQSFRTPPDTSPLRESPASAPPSKSAAARRRPRHQRASQTPKQPSHTMLRRSRARVGRAQERRFWELDASGRRARRIVGG